MFRIDVPSQDNEGHWVFTAIHTNRERNTNIWDWGKTIEEAIDATLKQLKK